MKISLPNTTALTLHSRHRSWRKVGKLTKAIKRSTRLKVYDGAKAVWWRANLIALAILGLTDWDPEVLDAWEYYRQYVRIRH